MKTLQLPITESELETIIITLKGSHPALHAKLWSYKMNYLNKEKSNGLS
jgi:hypothetical protein